ncbi:KH domain-containing protein [Candidatus Micrarchaeota archaeon]|nr:KH domain-containing protein [Candidatus Micrarchaeota archaeon]MBU1930503.1 KH domain-containing protein [Candidatus Micrarchaeota archaeon]
MTGLQEFVRIPKARIAILIGKHGATKKDIEQKTKTKIIVDSEEGEVEIKSKIENTTGFYTALNIIKAIARGFSPEHAFLLLNENNALEIISLTDWLKGSEKELKTKRGRIIGKQGKARNEIEEKTNCFISVQGKTIAIIGDLGEIPKAKKSIEMLLHGARHSKVYDFLNHPIEKEEFEF